MTTILVTGAAGYLGSTLCPMLLAAGHRVIGVDSFIYSNQQTTALASSCANPNFTLVRGDVLDHRLMSGLTKSADVVIPLAAIVGAPACAQNEEAATIVNRYAIEWLSASLSPNQRIIFPNSNSGYGSVNGEPCTEETPLRPISLYGLTKCAGEDAVLQHPNSIVLRLGTAYGSSPRMRTDLLINDLTLRAVRDGSFMVFEGHHRRSAVHIRDIAAAFLQFVDSPLPNHRVYNVVGQNLTKRELCAAIQQQVPSLKWHEAEYARDPDQRDYAVDSSRLRATGWAPEHTIESGITELLKLYKSFPSTAWGNV